MPVDIEQTRPGALLARLDGAGDEHAFAEPIFLNERSRHVSVAGLGAVIASNVAEKAEALGMQLQDALAGCTSRDIAVLSTETTRKFGWPGKPIGRGVRNAIGRRPTLESISVLHGVAEASPQFFTSAHTLRCGVTASSVPSGRGISR